MTNKMSIRSMAIVAIGCLAWAALPMAFAQDCQPTERHHAVKIGPYDTPDEQSFDHGEVYGNHPFFTDIWPGWTFAVIPQKYGWKIGLYDDPQYVNAIDLASITPPYSGGIPNPRDIAGWHFRNADNTGPNMGDVNAPQLERRFLFSPALAGTGGYKPSNAPGAPQHMEPSSDDGIGWLKILDYGLSDLNKGEKARMTYMKFEGCLIWPKSEDDIQIAEDAASPYFLDEEQEIFGSCGLDLQTYKLHAEILPRLYGGDIDGDDAGDDIAQIKRASDGKRGLAVCRAGTYLDVLGMDENMIGDDLSPAYFDQIEHWDIIRKGSQPYAYVNSKKWPDADGDMISLERIEKQNILLFWKDGALQSQELYRMVEP